eukprot:m.114313 g.114313  ORF g.114313 m.114313 type:complete len:178 (+) comp22925_c0_seq1:385-918(+)
MTGSRKLEEVDESGVDRSYYHGKIARDEAVKRLQEFNQDGGFLLRMSATQANVYTISLQAKGEIKHIRVNNVGDKYSLGKSKDLYESIWDLIEAQLDRTLKSTRGDDAVELIYPLPCAAGEAIAPDLLKGAKEAGMDPASFDPDVMAFMSGEITKEELAKRRKAKLDAGGIGALKIE